MKGNGLSSTSRTILKKANKQSAYASTRESFLAAKEKQKALRLQAEKAQADRNERERRRLADASQELATVSSRKS